MKSNGWPYIMIILVFGWLLGVSGTSWTKEEPGSWETAGKEISEAARAVGRASENSWQKTKEKTAASVQEAKTKGAEVWDKTKRTSSEVADKTVAVSEDAAGKVAVESKSLWQKSKETARWWYARLKARIHEMTVPE